MIISVKSLSELRPVVLLSFSTYGSRLGSWYYTMLGLIQAMGKVKGGCEKTSYVLPF